MNPGRSLLIWALLLGKAAIAADDPAAPLPPYRPQPVARPRDQSYLAADGAIRIVGYADVAAMIEAWDRLFAAAHPGFTFAFAPRLTRQAAHDLAAGASALAPMGAEFEAAELADYRRQTGAEPLAFAVAHDPTNPQAKSGPVGIFVHPANPLASLTTDQVARIFAAADAGRGLTRWSQLGLTGTWREAGIIPCGVPFGVGLGAFMQRQFRGRPASVGFLPFRQSEEILAYVATHPGAIGFARMNPATRRVKLLGIDAGDGRGPSWASRPDLISGRYAYDRPLLIYVRRPVEPWIGEYLRLVYSRAGQEAVASSPPFYLPLTRGQSAAELARLAQ
jgi:phosphate transport system substrate-binding protein